MSVDHATEATHGTPEPAHPVRSGWRWVRRALALFGAAVFVGFWTWALFFASKEAVNRIDDRDWAGRAQAICEAKTDERLRLANFTEMRDATAAMVRQRAAIVDEATDILTAMLDDVVATTPSDAKGRDIVPQWEAEYRTYLDDRRQFSARLRATGVNEPFAVTEVSGIPISERLATFAADNDMPDCAPPTDLSR